jgi:hypothetical protein
MKFQKHNGGSFVGVDGPFVADIARVLLPYGEVWRLVVAKVGPSLADTIIIAADTTSDPQDAAGLAEAYIAQYQQGRPQAYQR